MNTYAMNGAAAGGSAAAASAGVAEVTLLAGEYPDLGAVFPYRSAADNYAVAVDFSGLDVFAAGEVTAATAVVTRASVGAASALTLGAVAVADNVGTFRVSGGVNGATYTVTVTATNDVPDVKAWTLTVPVDAR